jgi:hypothetical protein
MPGTSRYGRQDGVLELGHARLGLIQDFVGGGNGRVQEEWGITSPVPVFAVLVFARVAVFGPAQPRIRL